MDTVCFGGKGALGARGDSVSFKDTFDPVRKFHDSRTVMSGCVKTAQLTFLQFKRYTQQNVVAST